MTASRARVVLVVSLAVVVSVVVAWALWPESSPRADLVADEAPAPVTTSTTAPPQEAVAGPMTPIRVEIPELALDAAVIPVGLETNGDMELPPAAQIGWYELGPSPGEPGSAVLAGHVDYNGERGAFFELRHLPVGAEVVVHGEGGVRRTFVVTEREQLAKSDVDLARYFTRDGPTRVTLITCGGVFDQGPGHYLDNILVTAELMSSPGESLSSPGAR